MHFTLYEGRVYASWGGLRPDQELGSLEDVGPAMAQFLEHLTQLDQNRRSEIDRQPTIHQDELPQRRLSGQAPREFAGRKEDRIDVAVPGAARKGTKKFGVMVQDLSLSGCMMVIPSNALDTNDRVGVTIGTVGPIMASVRWRMPKKVGLLFDKQLHPSVLDYIRSEMDVRGS